MASSLYFIITFKLFKKMYMKWILQFFMKFEHQIQNFHIDKCINETRKRVTLKCNHVTLVLL